MTSIFPTPLYSDIFNDRYKKSTKTFFTNLIIEQKITRVKTRLEIDPAKIISQTEANEIKTRRGTWILCSVKIMKSDEVQNLSIYIKKNHYFTPIPLEEYTIAPTIKISNNATQHDLTAPTTLLLSYIAAINLPKVTSDKVIKKKSVHPGRGLRLSIRKTNHNVFFIENKSIPKIGEGCFKKIRLALKVKFNIEQSAIKFLTEDRVIIKPKKAIYKEFSFLPPCLEGLNHEHLGIPKVKEVFLRIKGNTTTNYLQPIRFTKLAQGDLYYYKIIDIKNFLDAFKQLISGLDFLHQNNIFHGDIKTSNFLFYTDDSERTKFKIEDLDSADNFPSSKVYEGYITQTLDYANLRIIKQFINPISYKESIENYEKKFFSLISKGEIYLTPSHERNSMGLALTEIYIKFIGTIKDKHITMTMSIFTEIEYLLYCLTRFPIRDEKGNIPETYTKFKTSVNKQILSLSLDEIEGMIESIPPCSYFIERLNLLTS